MHILGGFRFDDPFLKGDRYQKSFLNVQCFPREKVLESPLVGQKSHLNPDMPSTESEKGTRFKSGIKMAFKSQNRCI